jgi:hypothetical protein
VKRDDLLNAGLTALAISRYSYQKGGTVYLEEDCDAGCFLTALKQAGTECHITEKNSNRSSPIRNFSRFGLTEAEKEMLLFRTQPQKRAKDMTTNKNEALEGQLLASIEILALAEEGYNLEISLTLAGNLRSTHFLSCKCPGLYLDEGCDGEVHEIREMEFFAAYPNELGKIWHLDQKVPSFAINQADLYPEGFSPLQGVKV